MLTKSLSTFGISISGLGLYKKFILLFVFFHLSWLCVAQNQVLSLSISQDEKNIIIKPRLNFKTSADIKEAIDNGIRVQLIVKAQMYEPTSWWFDKTIGNEKITLEFSYFILSKLYVVKNKDTEDQISFNEYEDLWRGFEKLAIFNFARQASKKNNNNSWVKMRVVLDK